MTMASAGALLGGLGLFLLGMVLMTDGLKLAAGPALSRLLARSTQTRWRGLLTGIGVTALVQSSSAVTVAAIGFVNAGLLSFGQSLWVLFGANVGTTMTGWLVALIGLKIKVEAAALPLIGIGMALRLSGPDRRHGAAGSALAGFGVLFLGIGFLQSAFAGAGTAVDLTPLVGHGAVSVLAFVAAGLVLTVLMQSSSASLAIVLTLAASGVLPLSAAAAAVIGANIGTTVTALLASIGATANARRAAAAHILFNVMTGLVALLMLPLLLAIVARLRDAIALDASPAATLALFHTVFNVLGVALMWPLAAQLAAFLQRRFRSREEALGHPRFLDANVVTVPSLAIDALRREIVRLGGLAVGAVRAHSGRLGGQAGRPDEPAAAAMLSRGIADFVAALSRREMSAISAQALAALLRVQRYYDTCTELTLEAFRTEPPAQLPARLQAAVAEFCAAADRLLNQLNPDTAPFAAASVHQSEQFEADYQSLKAALLVAGARGELAIDTMDNVMRQLSALRRAVEQAIKAAHLLARPLASGGDAAALPQPTADTAPSA